MMASQEQHFQYAMIDGYLLDACINETHEYKSEITKYPTERGGTFSDNIRNEPITVSMECIVSNSPIGQIELTRTLPSAAGETPSGPPPTDEFYAHLLKMRDARQPVTIRTSLQTFTNMGLESLSIPRAKGGGQGLRVTANFQQIDVVEVNRDQRVTRNLISGTGAGAILVDTKNLIWFDPAISAWRHTAGLPRVTNDKIPIIVDARGVQLTNRLKWVLFKSRPTTMSLRQYNELRVQNKADKTRVPDSILKRVLHPLGQRVARPPLGRPNEILVSPADYIIQ